MTLTQEEESPAKTKKDAVSNLASSLELALKRIDELEKQKEDSINIRIAELEKKLEESSNKSDIYDTPAITKKLPDDDVMVKGIFRNYEQKDGGSKKFFFGPSNNIKVYELREGVASEVPLSVAKHLEHNCYRPKYSHQLTDGKNLDQPNLNVESYSSSTGAQVVGKDQRFGFTPMPSVGGW